MPHVLLTGASGFLGARVLQAFLKAGWEVTTLGRRDVPEAHLHLTSDLLSVPNLPKSARYDRVVHLAGKAHSVPRTAAERNSFRTVNLLGTEKLLEALSNLVVFPPIFLFASSVAVYGIQQGENIDESLAPNPLTPYGESKLNAERAIAEWIEKRGGRYLHLRLPLVCFWEAPGNLGAMQRAFQRRRYVRIRGNEARKSMVWAEDVADLITTVTGQTSGAWHLTDGHHPSFSELESCLQKITGNAPILNIPMFWLRQAAVVGDLLNSWGLPVPLTSDRLDKLTFSLTFNDSAARHDLGWRGTSVIEHFYQTTT